MITGVPTSMLVGGGAVVDVESGIVDTIRTLIEKGDPVSLVRALDLIREQNLDKSEFGRSMNFVVITLFQKLYPDNKIVLPSLDPAQGHIYTRIIRASSQQIYTPPRANSTDYLEYTLPFLTFLPINSDRPYKDALPDLLRAEELNPDSVLAPYFIGLISESSGDLNRARASYERAYRSADTCYPAALGIVRVMDASGEQQSATRMLQNLAIIWPDNMTIKRVLALNYYKNRDWSHAGSAIAEILQQNPRDRDFILMRAHVFVETGLFLQAQTALDQYAMFDANNIFYLFLRARVQSEGYRNRDAALTYLRTMLRSPLVTEEMLVYTTLLFMESPRQEEQEEGRALLLRLIRGTTSDNGHIADSDMAADGVEPPLSLIELAFQDSLNRKAWEEAEVYLNRLLMADRTSRYLMGAYQIALGLGDSEAALSWARELHEKEPSNEEGSMILATALINAGAIADAQAFIEERLANLSSGSIKSRYYCLRSSLHDNEDDALEDLRSSIFEDARNLPALIGLFKLYLKRQDETRALYYLKQALALSPDALELQAYKQQYASRL
jgi:tetratricopeptide (TPR) repeat protein